LLGTSDPWQGLNWGTYLSVRQAVNKWLFDSRISKVTFLSPGLGINK